MIYIYLLQKKDYVFKSSDFITIIICSYRNMLCVMFDYYKLSFYAYYTGTFCSRLESIFHQVQRQRPLNLSKSWCKSTNLITVGNMNAYLEFQIRVDVLQSNPYLIRIIMAHRIYFSIEHFKRMQNLCF